MAAGSDLDMELIAPVPRISVQAFCETQEVAQVLQAAFADRRMERAHSKQGMGGANAAVEAFRHAPTPNVIILETQGPRSKPIECLDALAEVCDEGTRVLVIGHVATRWALDHVLNGEPLERLIEADFAWQEGWMYTLPIHAR